MFCEIGSLGKAASAVDDVDDYIRLGSNYADDFIRAGDDYIDDVIRLGDDYVDDTIRGIDNSVDDVIKGGASSRPYGDLSYASKYGIKPYKKLKADIKGTGLEAHHIVEKRLAEVLGISNTKSTLSVAVTKAEHKVFTNAWRSVIPYGTNYKPEMINAIMNYAQDIYKDYSALLDAIMPLFR